MSPFVSYSYKVPDRRVSSQGGQFSLDIQKLEKQPLLDTYALSILGIPFLTLFIIFPSLTMFVLAPLMFTSVNGAYKGLQHSYGGCRSNSFLVSFVVVLFLSTRVL